MLLQNSDSPDCLPEGRVVGRHGEALLCIDIAAVASEGLLSGFTINVLTMRQTFDRNDAVAVGEITQLFIVDTSSIIGFSEKKKGGNIYQS